MSNLHRYLYEFITPDLDHNKMVFIGGPRQVGKTTLALSFLRNGTIEHPAYLNWDDQASRASIKKGELPPDEPLIVLDEIHKYSRWRNLLKGFYDKRRLKHRFLVTGSARLDHYRRGGDSLVGRYHYFRLHPLSATELKLAHRTDLQSLLKFGGFPEPFYRSNMTFSKRWRRERLSRILNEDLRDLERVREIALIETLASLLPERVGSQLSYQNLATELEVDFKTVQHWIDILDNLYVTFRIKPFVSGRLRLIKRSERLYFWDWGGDLEERTKESGSQFENMVASHLLKYCHFVEDTQGDTMELRYLRDVDGREVDFVVLKNRKPLFAVESKTGDRAPSPALYYFQKRLPIPQFFQVHLGDRHYSPEDGIEVIPFLIFCKKIGIP